MPHHLLRYDDVMIDLAIVHLKLESDEVGQDRGRARLCLDGRRHLLAGSNTLNGEAVMELACLEDNGVLSVRHDVRPFPHRTLEQSDGRAHDDFQKGDGSSRRP